MDWEGGTIGAIVPALMGHGEAGRASPWPFSFSQFPIVKPKKQPPMQSIDGCRCFVSELAVDYENNSLMILPSRTRVIGRPVLVSYSMVGSIPRL